MRKKARSGPPKALRELNPKVFAKPEFQLPYHLAMYSVGPGAKRAIQAPMWLQVAILSGLVEMVSPNEAKAGDGLLKPIRKRHPLPRMTPEKLEALMLKGLAEALPYLSDKPEEKK